MVNPIAVLPDSQVFDRDYETADEETLKDIEARMTRTVERLRKVREAKAEADQQEQSV